jgi:hypothetical protein
MSSEEEIIDINTNDKMMYEEDKLQFVVDELRRYCDQNNLPFFKTSDTFLLFEKMINK